MERSFFLGIVIIIVLTTFATGSPIQEENDSNVMRRNSLLEKLGMELHRYVEKKMYKKIKYFVLSNHFNRTKQANFREKRRKI